MNNDISRLVKMGPVINSEDSVRRAASLIRATEGSRILAARDGRIAGTVSEQAIAGYLESRESLAEALESSVDQLIEEYPIFINSSSTLQQAAQVFAGQPADMLPVLGNGGALEGIIYRRDVVGALTRTLRPPSIAGMATPLGVYLTSGAHKGGAGSLGLFLTGMSLAMLLVISVLVVDGIQRIFSMATGIPVHIFLASPPLTMTPNIYDLAFYASLVLRIGIFLLLLRLSPLSGYHAAEHMTVHAIESGETVTPEIVSRMPRVHPRCGTNLMAAAGVFIILTSEAGSQLTVLLAILVVVLGWRTVGGMLQYFVTTRTPSEKQLESGVNAGNELLERYQQEPNRQSVGFERIWSMGFLQTASGMGLVFVLMSFLGKFFNIPILI